MTNIFLSFQESCAKNAARPAVIFKRSADTETVAYAELWDRVLRLRSILLQGNIGPGDRVAILLGNSPHWPAAFFAAMGVQAVAVPIDVQLPSPEIREILGHSRAKALLTEEKFSVALSEVLDPSSTTAPLFVDRLSWHASVPTVFADVERSRYPLSKLAALFYTSGTTSAHKAVMLTHANLLANVASIRGLRIVTASDTVLSMLPLHHTYPFMITCLYPLLEGASVVYLQSLVQHEIFAALKEHKVTIFVGVPQLYTLLAHSIAERLKKATGVFKDAALWALGVAARVSDATGRDLSRKILPALHELMGGHLRFMVSGGAKLDPDVARDFYRWGLKMVEGYGLTETSPVVTFNAMDFSKYTTVGKPLPGVSVRIEGAGEDGAGEVCVRGSNVMLGYYRAPALTRAVLKDGWFFSGDLGTLDRDGALVLTGRKTEIIVLASGKKVNPERLETHYLACPYLKDICVLKDPKSGGLFAVVVPHEDLLRAHGHLDIHFKVRWELDAYAQKLPPHQRLAGFVLTRESLPHTRLGKLIRYQVQERWARGHYHAEREAVVSEALSPFEATAVRYLSGILKREVRIDDHLELDLGLDSLGRIELLSALQDLVSVGIDDALALELFSARTVRELVGKARQALPDNAFEGLLKRDDTVSWSDILNEAPSPQSVARIKRSFDLFDRFVSVPIFWAVKLLFRTVFFLRVKGRENLPVSGPCVITPNHVSFLDAFYIVVSLPTPAIFNTYFVGFGVIFNHPLLRWGLRFFRLVPIDINLDLAETLRVCRFLLAQGKKLVYFPEGQRSADGELKEFRKGIGILLKGSGAKVLPVYLDGAYKAWPRQRRIPVPAPITVIIGKELSADGLSRSEDLDPYTAIADRLRSEVGRLVPPVPRQPPKK